VAAAAAFVCTGQALLDMDALATEEAVRQVATEATADAQVAEARGALADLRSRLAAGNGRTTFRQAPIAWRIAEFGDGRATVAIWSVGVLSREGAAPPQAGWAISTLQLVWERGDWRL